jgi:hypothetical protein
MDSEEKLIRKVAMMTAEATVKKLMDKRMIKLSSKTAYEKTFDLLKRYNQLSLSDSPETLKQIAQVDVALSQVRDNPYYAIIPMFFFKGETLESIADHFGVTVKTVRMRRHDLIDYMAVILFSDDVIIDILS